MTYSGFVISRSGMMDDRFSTSVLLMIDGRPVLRNLKNHDGYPLRFAELPQSAEWLRTNWTVGRSITIRKILGGSSRVTHPEDVRVHVNDILLHEDCVPPNVFTEVINSCTYPSIGDAFPSLAGTDERYVLASRQPRSLAYIQAVSVSVSWHQDTPTKQMLRATLRDVTGKCIAGVPVNGVHLRAAFRHRSRRRTWSYPRGTVLIGLANPWQSPNLPPNFPKVCYLQVLDIP